MKSPGTELALHHACGLLRVGQRRLEEALSEFRRAESMQAMLAAEHALTVDLRMRIVLTLVGMGDSAAASEALQRLSKPERDRAEGRIAAAALALADGDAERALALLSPVIDQSAPTWHPSWAAIHALPFAGAAHEHLGEAREAEASLERALELAEPEGLILPFLIAPVGELLERHSRHRTAHATLVSEIRDVLAGASPRARGEPAPPA